MITSVTLPNEATLEYIERGKASGIPVIFLHGAGDSCQSFEPLLDRLPDALRSFAITRRDDGRSREPGTSDRYAGAADELGYFMDALDLPSAIIAGHARGSIVAQRFAAGHPRRVAGLVLMAAVRSDFSSEQAPFTGPTLIVWGDADAHASPADQEALHATIPQSRLHVYAGAGHAFHREDPDRFAADLVAFVYERRVSSEPS